MSICARFHDKKVAEQQAEYADEQNIPMTDMNQHQLMLGKLRIDLRRLKMIKATDKKIEAKRDQIVPEYSDYIDGVLEANTGQQDDVLLYNMVWLIDTEDYERAITIGKYAIENEMAMPSRFNRDVPDLLAEYICNKLLKGDAEKVAEVTVENADMLTALYELVKPFDMHDAVIVKLYKAYGLAIQDSNPAKAIELLQKVYELDKRSGVANLIKLLKKKVDPIKKEKSDIKDSDKKDTAKSS